MSCTFLSRVAPFFAVRTARASHRLAPTKARRHDSTIHERSEFAKRVFQTRRPAKNTSETSEIHFPMR